MMVRVGRQKVGLLVEPIFGLNAKLLQLFEHTGSLISLLLIRQSTYVKIIVANAECTCL